MSLREQLLELEKRFWDASGDPGFWREHFDEDGVIALSMGLMDKDTVVSAQGGARPWDTYSLDDVRFVELDEAAASLTYRVSARRGDDPEYSAVITSVYARRDGDWRLMVHQQTPTE